MHSDEDSPAGGAVKGLGDGASRGVPQVSGNHRPPHGGGTTQPDSFADPYDEQAFQKQPETPSDLSWAYEASVQDGRIIQIVERPPSRNGSETIAVSIYLDYESREAVDALVDLLASAGIEIFAEVPPINGSWLGLKFGKFRRWLSADDAEQVIARIERAVSVRLLEQPQAEVDSKQAEAVARLMTALEKQESACIQVGSLFLIKVEGTVVARNLSPQEMSFLAERPSILRSPEVVLTELERASRDAANANQLATAEHRDV